MNLLLVGEDRTGSLTQSIALAFSASCQVSIVDPAWFVTRLVDRRGSSALIRRRLASRSIGFRFLEAVEQLKPDVTLIVKGRGIDPISVMRARRTTRVVIYYPDNPFWLFADTHDVQHRLASADLVVVWSKRIRNLLKPACKRVETIPFGYDDRWFPLTDPNLPRQGIAFLGSWHPRRERYLRALVGLPLTVMGSGWHRAQDLGASGPRYGCDAGRLLQRAAIGINIYHPHNAGAHNMRTREVAASGALQLTDPGVDGTPLRDSESCRWFTSPDHLRELAEAYLSQRNRACELAIRAQELIATDTYSYRVSQLIDLFKDMR